MEGSGREEFEQLYRAHARALLGYALRRVERRDDAVDVLADTMLVAWRRIADVPPGDEARLWLFGVARRVLANHRRGDRRRSRLGERLREELAEVLVEDAAVATETSMVVAAALARLDENDRELLRLTTWEGFEPHEIAVVLALPAATVRTRLHRARGRLRAQLDAVGWSDEDGSGSGDGEPGDGAARDDGERHRRNGHVGHDEQPLVRNAEDER